MFSQFDLLQRLRPVLSQVAGEGPVGQKFAAGLAAVGFVRSVDDPLDRRGATGAGLAEFAVRSYFRTEGGHLFGEAGFDLLTEEVREMVEAITNCREHADKFRRGQFLAERDRNWSVFGITVGRRGRDGRYQPPPAQTRACGNYRTRFLPWMRLVAASNLHTG